MATPSKPDVTIIVPTRERSAYLRVALHSILTSAAEAARAGIATEVLVVDDASPTNATRRLAAELGVGYSRIRRHSGRNDPAAAIAHGVARVESRYFSIFGDDDLMLPRFIPLHVAAMEAGADVCTSDYLLTDATLRATRTWSLFEPELGDLLIGQISVNDGAMTRTAVAKDLDWDPDLEQEILYAIWLELLFRGVTFAHLAEPTFLYRRHEANVSMALGPRDAELRRGLQERYRALLIARDGAVPVASHPPKPVVKPPRRRRLRPWRRLTAPLARWLGARAVPTHREP